MPYGCLLGSGRFSVLIEQQLLLLSKPSQEKPLETLIGPDGDIDSSTGQRWQPKRGEGGELPQVRQEKDTGETTRNGRSTAEPEPISASARGRLPARGDDHATRTQTQRPPTAVGTTTAIGTVCSRWECLVLGATRLVMEAEQLDRAALWALERALLELESSHDDNDDDSRQQHRESLHGSGKEHIGTAVTSFSQRSPQQAATDDIAREASDNGGSCEEQLRHGNNDETNSHQDETFGVASSASYAVNNEGGENTRGGNDDATIDNVATTTSTVEAGQVAVRATGNRDIGLRSSSGVTGMSKFCLELVWTEEDEKEKAGIGGGEEPHGKAIPPRLCGDLVRWGWRMTKLGLGHVIVRYVI